MGSGARETAGSLTKLIVQYVRRVGGDDAVARVLERSAVQQSVEALEDESNWCTYAEKLALWQAAAEVLDDPIVTRHMGETVLDTNINPKLRSILRSFGSPRMVLNNIARVAPKFATTSVMTARPRGRNEMVVTHENTVPPHRLDCESNIGLISAIGPLFGLPLLDIDELECQVDGAPRCVYVVRWPRWRRLRRRGGSKAYLREMVASLGAQVESLQSIAADLVSSEDTNEVLERILGHAARAVNAQRYLLAVRRRDDAPIEVFHDGFDGVDVHAAGAELLARTVITADPNRIVIDVASTRRHYGRLAAFYDDHTFFDSERELLAAYARSAAAALDAAAALEDARTRGETATALLDLARSLAVLSHPEQVAQTLAEAMCPVLGARQSSVSLYDRDRHALVLRGSHGLNQDQRALLQTVPLAAPHDEALREWLATFEPWYVSRTEARSDIGRVAMESLDVESMATVAIRRHGELLGIACVYFDDAAAVVDPAQMLSLMTAVADQAATAIENAFLLERAQHQATHDDLTGLPNRALFEHAAERALAHGERSHDGVALLFVDLDGFKAVNDDYGHDAGDVLLLEVARRLESCLRAGDVVARLGGDEFTVLLPGAQAAKAWEVAERIRATIADPIRIPDATVTVSACVGVAVAPNDASDYKGLVHAADVAMYRAKRSGGGRVEGCNVA
jgi:diguanylate cyclase (GGDEF)-like protein